MLLKLLLSWLRSFNFPELISFDRLCFSFRSPFASTRSWSEQLSGDVTASAAEPSTAHSAEISCHSSPLSPVIGKCQQPWRFLTLPDASWLTPWLPATGYRRERCGFSFTSAFKQRENVSQCPGHLIKVRKRHRYARSGCLEAEETVVELWSCLQSHLLPRRSLSGPRNAGKRRVRGNWREMARVLTKLAQLIITVRPLFDS